MAVEVLRFFTKRHIFTMLIQQYRREVSTRNATLTNNQHWQSWHAVSCIILAMGNVLLFCIVVSINCYYWSTEEKYLFYQRLSGQEEHSLSKISCSTIISSLVEFIETERSSSSF
mmetsp:Transcript_2548/g.3753  ORF Transcript_2548/g.3753 Transcript_2548/m.3753 type:complete len:115 (-) Transcript_2548:407-751(-)